MKTTLPQKVDDWHTYRITYQNGSSNVYLDENPTAILSGTSTSTNSTNDVRFGDGSDGNTHGFLLDWLIFDITGAYTPEETTIPDSLATDRPTSVEQTASSDLPNRYDLMQNYPNPFNPTTTIEFHLEKPENVSIVIFNAVGQKVARLVDGFKEQGIHRVTFDAADFSSGLFFYHIRTAGFSQTKKMLLLK